MDDIDQNQKGQVVTGEEVRKEQKPSVRKIISTVGRHESSVLGLVLIAIIGIFAGITKGKTIAVRNMVNVLLQSSIRGVASAGQGLVILTAGIDISVGGLGLLCSTLGAALMTKAMYINIVGYPMSPLLAIPIMLLVGAGIGLSSGVLVSRIGIPPLIVTLGMWQIVKGLAFVVCQGRATAQLPKSLIFLGSGKVAGVPVPVIIFVSVAIAGYIILQHTPFGRSIYATGGNPTSAWLSGINVKRVTLLAYVISGFLAGLAGVISTARTMSASMRTLTGLELDTIAAAAIGGCSLMGGKGNIVGVVIGVLIIGTINNGMSVLAFGPDLQGIVKGAIIVAAVGVDYLRRRG